MKAEGTMKTMLAAMAAVIGAALVASAGEWQYNKNENHPKGANKVDNLKKDGEHYIVTGADLHNLGADLTGKTIRFHGYASEIKRFPSRTLLLRSADDCYFAIMFWGTTMGNVPEDLRNRLANNGVRTAGGIINKYEGDKLTVWCTLDSLMKEGGMTGSVLKYRSCVIKTVDKWEKGWAETPTSDTK